MVLSLYEAVIFKLFNIDIIFVHRAESLLTQLLHVSDVGSINFQV